MRAALRITAVSPLVAAAAVFFAHADATAADLSTHTVPKACRFREQGKQLTLLGDCTTDHSIVIPDGFTLDGAHHRITALDPAGGSFRGAVVTNAGEEAHVRDIVVRAVELAPRCGPRDGPALAGIALVDCSGSVVDTHVEGIYRRGYACGEGTGIAVHAASTATTKHAVSITGNRIAQFGDAGVVIDGPLFADVQLNQVTGAGGSAHRTEDGVRLSRGATGNLRWNHVRALARGGRDAPSAGMRVSGTAGPVDVSLNRVEQTDVGIALDGAGGVRVEQNTLHEHGRAGVRLDGRDAATTDNQLRNNRTADAPAAVLLEGPWTRENDVRAGPIERVDSDFRELSGAHHNRFLPRE